MIKLINTEQKKQIHEFAKQLEPLYELFNWEWANWTISDGMECECPKADNIEKTIIGLIKELKRNKESQISTGGIAVSMNKDVGDIEVRWSLEKFLYL